MRQDSSINNPGAVAWIVVLIVVAALLYFTIALIVDHYTKKKDAREALAKEYEVSYKFSLANDDIIFKTVQESYPHDAN